MSEIAFLEKLLDGVEVKWIGSDDPTLINDDRFPGIFYRGGAEQKIRKYLVDNNYVETVISLAPNLFFGTTIAVNILVLAKNKTTVARIEQRRTEIDLIVAEIEGA